MHQDRLPKKAKTVAGFDVHYVNDLGIGTVAGVDYESLEILETSLAICNGMPYVLTLLSFRELPPALAAIKGLKVQPDVFLVNAQGGLIRATVTLPAISGWLWGNLRLEPPKIS